MRKNLTGVRTLLLLLTLCSVARADDLAALMQQRTAIEQVYYNHRLGQKPPFEQVSPPFLIERLVRTDLRREEVLKRVYGVKITSAMHVTEVQRIDATTRAPEMLAEIKTALGNDPAKFANAFAKPFLVERLLREKFENDDALHSPQRRECESIRNELLAAKTNGASAAELLAQLKQACSNAVNETTWQLGARPAQTHAPAAEELEIKRRFGPNAQLLSAAQTGDRKNQEFYFEDLPGDLQNVLRVQLCQAGDLSAVIEVSGGFLLYLLTEKTAETLSVAGLSLPKRNYEQWLEEQTP